MVERDATGRPLEPTRSSRSGRADDALVRVARAQHQAEAELIQNLLRAEGIPSITRRSAAFDVPDFLAAGPRDILVPSAAAEAARQLLTPPPDSG